MSFDAKYHYDFFSSNLRCPQVFPCVWEENAPRTEGLPLVAHNARFDEGCLKAVFRACGYDLTNHHHALADAEACATIAQKIL